MLYSRSIENILSNEVPLCRYYTRGVQPIEVIDLLVSLTVRISMPSGDVVTESIDLDESVLILKKRLCSKYKLNLSYINLIFGQFKMNDDKTLGEYKIYDDTTMLELTLDARPLPSCRDTNRQATLESQERKVNGSSPPPLPPPIPKERHLMNDVAAKAPEKWMVVGTMLDIHSSVLYSIDIQNKSNPMACYLAVFHHWQTSIDCPPFTWDTIVEVLESDVVHRHDLAVAIRRKYL
uniref:Ubiquitin-like domain-containing protein n=1 Tax=Amphimedon queenslandica TaxID=400682 RepID=A0A1X7STP1_AMPQE